MLTLAVESDMHAIIITVPQRSDRRVGGDLDLQLAELSWEPTATARGIAMLLEREVFVDIEYTDLKTSISEQSACEKIR